MLQPLEPDGNHIVLQLASKFGQEIEKECEELELTIPEKFGSGSVLGLGLHFGLNITVFDCKLNEPFEIRPNSGHNYNPLRIIFVKKGYLKHTIDMSNHYELNGEQCAVSACSMSEAEHLTILSSKPIKIVMLEINREKFIEKIDCELEYIHDALAKAFNDTEAKNIFQWTSHYCVEIEECLMAIFNTEYSSAVKRYFIEAKTYEIFSHLFVIFNNDTKIHDNAIRLRKTDVEAIKEAKAMLIEDLKDAPTIIELSRMAGINQQKLKKGFKQIYSTTPYKYLRNTRLNHSKLLLLEGSLSVSEVAEKVGYSNKSHFAKRFKQKFHVLPSKFIRNFKSVL